MSQKRRGMIGTLARGFFAAVAFVFWAGSLSAQGTTGKIEGTVLDPNGQPVNGAQVWVVGTSLGALTNDKGYYFLNNVPAGVYTLRGTYIGLQPAEVRNVRALAGQTMTVDFGLSAAVQLGAITVTVEQAPLVPRDQVTSKPIVSGQLVERLPVDDIRAVLALQPGVVESGSGLGLSIRGGRPGEAAVYVDGALVRSSQSGSSRLTVGTNALEEASITTGAFGAEFGDAQSGVISFVTRAGGQGLRGSLSFQTDEAFGDALSVGYNGIEGAIGGPLFGSFTFFVAGTLQGQQSPFLGSGHDTIPSYVMGGLDTTVTYLNSSSGDSTTVAIPQFVQWGGSCDAALNFGFECQGRRRAMDWENSMTGNAKLQYTYGGGSRLSLSALTSQDQNRNFPGAAAQAPQRFSGTRDWSRAYILNWTQQVTRSTERALNLDVNLSWQSDNQIAGPLDRDWELNHRDPFAALAISPMKFVVDFDHFSDDAGTGAVASLNSQADWDQLVSNIRNNTGTRVPYLDLNSLRNAQPYRMNPWAISTGYSTEGLDVPAQLYQERRLQGRASLDWQFDRFNRFKFGGDAQKSRVNFFSSNILRQSFMDAYSEAPVKYGMYGEDRLDLGDVVVVLGLRYDYFNTRGLVPRIPGTIFTLDQCTATINVFCVPTGANPVDSSMVPATSHSTWSPRVQVSFPVTDRTGFRLSYAHQVQSPDFATILTGVNNDLSFTNTNDVFARDVTFGKTIQFEFGVRHAFSEDMLFDVSAYNKDKVSDLTARVLPFVTDLGPDVVGTADDRTENINVLTNADFGNVRGVDVSLVRRISDYFNGSLAYTFEVAKSTGSDPLSYLNTTARQISAVTNDRVPPPQAILPTNANRTHTIAGSLAFSFPGDFGSGLAGSLLRNGGAFARFRFSSGLPYTRLSNAGNGQTAPNVGFGLAAQQAEPINSSEMPWIKQFDLRLTKGLRVGGVDWTVFGDFRNLFNFRNVVALFAETGDIVNAEHRIRAIQPEVERLVNAAGSRLVELPDPANPDGVILAVSLANCGAPPTGSNINTVDCVLLRRAEARFGNGDGIYDENEYRAAFGQEYMINNGTQQFLGQPRHVRLGIEVNF